MKTINGGDLGLRLDRSPCVVDAFRVLFACHTLEIVGDSKGSNFSGRHLLVDDTLLKVLLKTTCGILTFINSSCRCVAARTTYIVDSLAFAVAILILQETADLTNNAKHHCDPRMTWKNKTGNKE